ncbi:DUF4882 domain-containing protein [Acinetobacter sp. C26M]|uniref:DUF4882 family protein n=1 Tax=unclassified Acinetobacter TaxID=196816 RepID=UPI0020370A03|nr:MULTISPECIES: DUF4882 family protein [unclassified Acinetobacter]USA45185.1 DUF4882 domain-containing protein [Acinetobacter sp. C26M]USA48687.1 DUF4882 domain-containing protein [Acinetobacter sp. C26G]
MQKLSIFALSLALLGCGENQDNPQNNTSTQPSAAAATSFSLRSFSQPQTCQYNFDATQQDYDALWNNQNSDYLVNLFPTINGQKFSLTVAPPYSSNSDPEYGTFNYLQYLATSKAKLYSAKDSPYFPHLQDGLGDFNLPKTGILALEMQLDIPAAPLNGGYYGEPGSSYISDINFNGITENGYIVKSLYSFAAGSADPDFGENPPFVLFNLSYQKSDYTEYSSAAYYYNKLTEYQSKYHRLGIYINQNTKQVGFIVNGVDQGYQGTLPAPLKNIGFDIRSWVGSDQDGTFSDKLEGLEFSSELITDRNSLQFNYPQGTTDICGNAI